MTGTVVKTTKATKRFKEVGFEEAEGGGVGSAKEYAQEMIRFLGNVNNERCSFCTCVCYRVSKGKCLP